MPSSIQVWKKFKWLVEYPGQEKGVRKNVGIALYACCLLTALVFAVAMFRGSQSTHVSYKSEGSDGATAFTHRLPDLVTCPREVENPKTEYNVHLNPETVSESGISYSEIDKLAKMHRELCGSGTNCDWSKMQVPCDGTTFQKHCENLHQFYLKDSIYPKFNPEILKKRREEKFMNHDLVLLNQAAAMAILFEKNNGRWTLQMLWLSVIFSGYNPIQEIVSQRYTLDMGRSGINCYYYKNTERQGIQEDREQMLRQQETTQTTWVGKSLCLVQLGSFFPEKSTPFYGCRAFVGNFKYIAHFPNMWPPFRYWFGDLSTTVLKEDAFYLSMATNPSYKDTLPRRVNSGVIHYNSITVIDETKTKKACVTQPLVRGLQLPCLQNNNSVVKWSYDVSTQRRQLSTIWVYADTKITLRRLPTFTLYTKLTFGAGLFGCLLGMSLAQILEMMIVLAMKCVRERFRFVVQAFRFVLLLILVTGSTSLTIWDTLSYTNDRYMPIFTEKESDLEIPAWKICPDSGMDNSFLNITRFYELNVSLQLYGYLKWAGVFRYPVMKIISKTDRFVNGTITKQVPAWMVQNVRPPVDAVAHCEKDLVFCENWPETTYLGRLFPHPTTLYKPRLYNASKRRQFLKEMDAEIRVLEKNLGLPQNTPIHQIIAAFFLDPQQLITECRVRGTSVRNCGQYAKYTYYGNAQFCLSVRLPERVVRAERNYGYRQGLSVTIDHAPFYEHGDSYSYYGPGTQQIRRENIQDTRCYTTHYTVSPKSAESGFISESCSVATGYSFIMQLSSYSTTELDYRFQALLPPTAFVAEVRTGFTQNQLDSQCEGQTVAPACRYPNEEMAALYMALHFSKQCGCSFCYGSDTSEINRVLGRASEILGHATQCCRATEIMSCYSDVIENVDWRKKQEIYNEFMKDPKFRKIGETDIHFAFRFRLYKRKFRTDPAFVMFQNFFNGAPSIAAKDMKGAELNSIRKLFLPHIFEKFSNESLERLQKFTKECYTKTCKLENLELVNIQPQEPGINKSYITIFYNTPKTHGMKLVDLFDPVQFVATLLAAYSVTLGISLIGLLEILVLLIRQWKHSDGTRIASETGTHHIMRGPALVLSSMMKSKKIQPERETVISIKISGPPIDRKISAKVDGDNAELVGSSYNTNQKQKVCSHGLIGSNKEEDVIEIQPQVQNMKAQDREKTENAELSKTSSEKELTDEKLHNKTDRVYLDRPSSVFLLVFLGFFFIASGFCVSYFFLSFTNSQFDGQVAESSLYERPSTVICVENESLVDALLKGITEASCATSEGTSMGCDKLFQTFIRNHGSRYSVAEDNTRKMHKGDETKDDLIIKVPQHFPPVVVGAVSFNQSSSLAMIYPYSEWKEGDALLSYTMTLTVFETSTCIETIPLKRCQRCPSNLRQVRSSTLCCLNLKKYEPAIPDSQTCSNYQFGIKVSPRPRKPGALGRTLSVTAAKRNMLVYGTKVKYSFVYYVSIVGGFFGAFVELTVLNVVGPVCMLAVGGIIRVRKWMKRTTTDS